eukprot:521095-Hanusia_phi.AAC.1
MRRSLGAARRPLPSAAGNSSRRGHWVRLAYRLSSDTLNMCPRKPAFLHGPSVVIAAVTTDGVFRRVEHDRWPVGSPKFPSVPKFSRC